MISYWEKTSRLAPAELLVVGGGITGLSAAIAYKERRPQARVVLLERGVIPAGASTKNAGFACFGSISELLSDLEHSSESEVFALVEKRWKGLQLLRQRIGEAEMGFRPNGGYELFRDPDSFRRCAESLDFFNQQLYEITGSLKTYEVLDSRRSSAFGFSGEYSLIFNTLEGQLHPGKMMSSLLRLALDKEVDVLGGWEVTGLEQEAGKWIVYGKEGLQLRAEKILIATNGFASQLLPDLPLKPARNQVLITEPIPDLPWEGCFHLEEGYFYFRNVGKRVLLGGGRHLAPEEETTAQFGLTPRIREALEKLLYDVIIPERRPRIDSWWSGILGVGPRKRPVLKWHKPGLAVAVRLGGMGVALGSLLGEEAAELLIS